MAGPADSVAIEAANRLHAGEAGNIGEAIAQAQAACQTAAWPSGATVRRHLEALRQADQGMHIWARERLARLEALEELLQTITYVAPDVTLYVTGRAAEGHVDDTGPSSVRVVGAVSPPAIMDDLEAHGVPPMEVAAVSTPMGSLTSAHVQDGHLDAVLLFLPDVPEAHLPRHVVHHRPVAAVDIDAFAELVRVSRSAGTP